MSYFLRMIKDYKDENLILNYGRPIILAWVKEFALVRLGGIKVLDVGCGPGDDLENIIKLLSQHNKMVEAHGLEFNPAYQSAARLKGIQVEEINLEKDAWPYQDAYFDVVIINQVLEHTKEFFWIISQASRVLKDGGLLIIGTPNLAAWYNRLLLLFGRQPACIKLGSEHFRAFTRRDLSRVMTTWGGFELVASAGSNFYPLPKRLALLFSRLFPSLAVSLFLSFKKKTACRFFDFVKNLPETNYKI